MKSRNKRKQKSENTSRFDLIMREILESFIRKTDSEKRALLVGVDPFRR
jgi:hypothetical protein